jgi:hypothetical protein
MLNKKGILTLMGTSFFLLSAFSQKVDSVEVHDTKKMTKEQKAAQKQFNADVKAKMVEWMVTHQKLVMESNYAFETGGARNSVNPTTNYIELDSTRITVQIASTSGIGGQNGIGGFTIDGTISKYTYRTFGKKKNGYNVEIIAMSRQGTFEVFMSVYPDGNAEANMAGINRVGKINLQGFVLPLNKAKTSKGLTM